MHKISRLVTFDKSWRKNSVQHIFSYRYDKGLTWLLHQINYFNGYQLKHWYRKTLNLTHNFQKKIAGVGVDFEVQAMFSIGLNSSQFFQERYSSRKNRKNLRSNISKILRTSPVYSCKDFSRMGFLRGTMGYCTFKKNLCNCKLESNLLIKNSEIKESLKNSWNERSQTFIEPYRMP